LIVLLEKERKDILSKLLKAFPKSSELNQKIIILINKKITKKITVNVTDIEITSITLDKSSETIKIGETLSLIKTISPNNASSQNVSWDSSNTSVATVDSNGLVTGKGTGSAIISVRTANGKVASCMVEVK
jgi:uncharacterized protein YjdB